MEIIRQLNQLNSQTEEKIKDDLLFSSTNLAVTVSANRVIFWISATLQVHILKWHLYSPKFKPNVWFTTDWKSPMLVDWSAFGFHIHLGFSSRTEAIEFESPLVSEDINYKNTRF